MIVYLLKCKNMHEFESWFSSSTEYDQLRKKNLIECIFCGSKKIEKSIMSPNIVGKKDKIDNRFDSREFIKIKKKMQEIKKFVEKNFEFVGDKFTREVREIYYDNKKNKNIYGTVSFKEREELDEEGIELTSIPWIKNKEN
mgnify:CR=1 FL=1|jgi:hypothetical protein